MKRPTLVGGLIIAIFLGILIIDPASAIPEEKVPSEVTLEELKAKLNEISKDFDSVAGGFLSIAERTAKLEGITEQMNERLNHLEANQGTIITLIITMWVTTIGSIFLSRFLPTRVPTK